MKTLASFFLLTALAAAQTPPPFPSAVFPGRLATTTDLQQAANTVKTTLTAPVNPADLTINVVSATIFPVPSSISIDFEIIKICAKGGASLTVCAGGRGAEGTSALSTHLAGASVQQRLTAAFHNQMAAEVMAVEKRALYMPYVSDFGAVCDGVTDDSVALLAAMAYANANTTNIMLPPGKLCGTTKSIVVGAAGNGLIFKGQAAGNSGIVALPGGTWSTYHDIINNVDRTFLLSIGAPNCTVAVPYVEVRDMELSGAEQVDTAGVTNCAEENSGFRNILAGGAHFSDFFFGYNAINSHHDDLTMYMDPGAYGLFNLGITRNAYTNLTFSGGGVAGAAIANYGNASVDNIHCENLNECIHNFGAVFASNIDCSPGSTIHTSCIVNELHAAVDLHVLTTNGVSGWLVTDFNRGITGLPIGGFGMQFYISNGVVLMSSDPSVPWIIPNGLTMAGGLALPGPITLAHEVIGDWGGGAYFSIANSGNPQGMLVQSAQTQLAGSREGGGLALNGGGYAGDPSFGSMTAGSVFDGGTSTATALLASGIVMSQGAGVLFGNTGLSVDSIFTANIAFAWDSQSITIPPKTAAVTCDAGHRGRVWINANVSPYRFELCLDTGIFYINPSALTAGP